MANCKAIGQNNHEHIMINKAQLSFIKENLGKAPLFDKTLAEVKANLDAEIAAGFDVPVPKDLAGGYTHETHKKNYVLMEQAGAVYRITGDEKYASFVRDMLLKYVELFPTLGLHPAKKSYSRGKLFWQCLNDANWLVSVSQAYDNIYEWLNNGDRLLIEAQLLKPYAEFLSTGNPQFFNRIHNHSTWACAAVGLTGLAIGDEQLVKNALYGLENDGIKANAYDNDGALIKSETKGFLAQIDGLFSPDGLYSEGPYYHRYAIYPFLLFAVGIENAKPELEIFKYRDGSLLKSVNTLLGESNEKGDFFPLNDAQKGMSIYNTSLISAVDIAYYYGNKNPGLLSIAKTQDAIKLDASGMAVALNLSKAKPMIRKSMVVKDGKNGDMGALGILRSGNGKELVFKFGSQGMGHGHFDKLSYSFYNNGNEVVQDYGMARFVNIEQKNGGGYLKENTTFAKQSIAHNTLVINETSHFEGNTDIGELHAPYLNFNDISDTNIQVISASDSNAYDGIKMSRTLFMLDGSFFDNPITIDLLKVNSEKPNQYDLPLYYKGQWIATNFEYQIPENLSKIGSANGYQHIWKEAEATLDGSNIQFTWLNHGTFYTYTAASLKDDEFIAGRLGATDPNFNLRRDPLLIHRRKNSTTTSFASVTETHGSYSPVNEKSINPYGSIRSITIELDTEDYTVLRIKTDNKEGLLAIANKDFHNKHLINFKGSNLKWEGPFNFNLIEK
ncbi:alginate lyase family protein [uncultured Arcticibacterium sp.]|uniref:alginate lyase family protein n=1 Tax=uncultured Arcticibacterium sp. TaxID=2173042 RepID=UPI0030F93DC3